MHHVGQRVCWLLNRFPARGTVTQVDAAGGEVVVKGDDGDLYLLQADKAQPLERRLDPGPPAPPADDESAPTPEVQREQRQPGRRAARR